MSCVIPLRIAEPHDEPHEEPHDQEYWSNPLQSRQTLKMATKKTTTSIIKNADTLARRAWVDSALSSARSQLNVAISTHSTVESAGHEPATQELLMAAAETHVDHIAGRKHARLYVAWSHGERRSET
jgi:hypothetical protein